MDLSKLLFEKKTLDYCLRNTKHSDITDMTLVITTGMKKFPIWNPDFNSLLLSLINKTVTRNKSGKFTTTDNFVPVMSDTKIKVEYLYQVHQLSNQVNKLVKKLIPKPTADEEKKSDQIFNEMMDYVNKINEMC